MAREAGSDRMKQASWERLYYGGNSQSFYYGGLAFDDAVEDRVGEVEGAYGNGEGPY